MIYLADCPFQIPRFTHHSADLSAFFGFHVLQFCILPIAVSSPLNVSPPRRFTPYPQLTKEMNPSRRSWRVRCVKESKRGELVGRIDIGDILSFFTVKCGSQSYEKIYVTFTWSFTLCGHTRIRVSLIQCGHEAWRS